MDFIKSPAFMLFGMGHRRKLVYLRGGLLLDAQTCEPVQKWEIQCERFEPESYTVSLEIRGGAQVRIIEDETAVWIEEHGDRREVTRGSTLHLPRFDEHRHGPLLRALHAELLVNIMPFGPVPNLWVYPRPWYRDAAMMLMCFASTGNLHLVESWVTGLRKVWDRNNSGEPEADNPGQVLYMLSLFELKNHPLIGKIMKALPDYQRDKYIIGRSDYAEHPVYQTKWLKYGLRSLGMDDPYQVPEVFDSYSSLFWMDYRDQHVDGPRFSPGTVAEYPYLGWAEAHFHRLPQTAPDPGKGILTWEGSASEADYWRMEELAKHGLSGPKLNMCTPHTWHAAEMFLYLMDKDLSLLN